ncbi:protein kinase [Wenjunlia vitaminophila]|uniref:non-specific serine/threonine protein kinase n=1 Tax=Wenjunlia vitaminophila TaxID=76728 RepID=A0A0T6LMR4_WENVI|nr:serine/threonine-protein kinase [Wenjunlia vitaminophila]KRV47170.1 protein kinase [Wenjunlia vitaminophila]
MTHDGGQDRTPTSYSLQPPGRRSVDGPPVPSQPPAEPPAEPSAQDTHRAVTQTAIGAAPPQPSAATPPRPSPAAPAGRLLGGRYRLRERLGYGGMGTVWKAHDEVVDRDVAVKEPRVPDHLPERQRATAFSRMRREARVAARIDHPSVVTIHDVVMEDEQPWIVMELVRGRSLADLMDEGILDPQEAARIALPVLGALGAAHEAGVLHRDVKPANVLLGPYDRVVLTDFGIAQVEGEAPLTETGLFVGSPEYIAPERVLGQRPGPASDIFSLGVLLYTAVEGWSPFRRSTTPATLQAVVSGEPAPPVRAGQLGELILRCLSKDPDARPTARAAASALEAVIRPRSQPTTPPAPAPTVLDPTPQAVGPTNGGRGPLAGVGAAVRGRRGVRIGLAALVLAVVAGVGVVVADPFGGDSGLPEGWKQYDENERVKAQVAAPESFKRSANEQAVTYSDPAGVHTMQVERRPGVDKTSLTEANDWLKSYREDYTKSDVKGQVTERKFQGEPAAEVVTTYRSSNSDDTKLYRSRELIFVDKDTSVEWRLVVWMPGEGEQVARGDEIFTEAVQNLEVNGG